MRLPQRDKRFGRRHAFRKLVESLAPNKAFAKAPVMAVCRKQRCLIVAQMAQPIGGKFIAAHGANQARHLSGAARHQRTLHAGKAAPVQHAGGNANDVFGRRAQLCAHKVVPLVQAN